MLVTLTICGCKQKTPDLRDYKSESFSIVKIGTNTFVHTSYLHTGQWGAVPCNGMIYVDGGEAIIFDAPVNDQSSQELITWLDGIDIKAIVATHYHVDCLGGLGAFHQNNIPSYALEKTIELAKEKHAVYIPRNSFKEVETFAVGDEKVEARFLGAGHTHDNIVGYLPKERTLFGGCLIKAQGASTGNLEDANVLEWPTTVKKIKEFYPDIQKVIPGHGVHGGKELLDYTFELFEPKPRFLFFLHNRFLETHDLEDEHPEYGRTKYHEIIDAFKSGGLNVISEQRKGNVNAQMYATTVVEQIDSLIAKGVPADHITIAGTSKGGYIAQYVSTIANRPDLNFVFIASFQDSDLHDIPEINYCGNILNIYEISDPYGASAKARLQNTTCEIRHFKEIELQTGLGHGFLFQPIDEWITPTISWAKGKYIFP